MGRRKESMKNGMVKRMCLEEYGKKEVVEAKEAAEAAHNPSIHLLFFLRYVVQQEAILQKQLCIMLCMQGIFSSKQLITTHHLLSVFTLLTVITQ